MDAGVYDHIQEESLKRRQGEAGAEKEEEAGSLTTDLQETYQSFTNSAWGARIGGFWGSATKQAQSYLNEATREASSARDGAFKGLSDLGTSLVGRARTLSVDKVLPESIQVGGRSEESGAAAEGGSASKEASTAAAEDASSPAFIDRFRSEASKRLAELQKAEDAADEALLKFGTNIRNFLRDAVTVTPPTEELVNAGKTSVLFESKDAEGKRVIHTTRFDAQLHVIHCSLDSFTKDPISPEYEAWTKEFNIDAKTDQIAEDLKKYEELRRAMEKLVPEKVEYAAFWRRYYFLRMVIESEEKRRREMLKEAAQKSGDADLTWDSDEEGPSTPQPRNSSEIATASTPLASSNHLQETRKSHDEKSTAGSESSYDLVSGATSAAPGSPQEKKEEKKGENKKDEEDEEDDWE